MQRTAKICLPAAEATGAPAGTRAEQLEAECGLAFEWQPEGHPTLS